MHTQLFPAHVLDHSEPYSYGFADTPYGPALLISKGGYLLAVGFTTSIHYLRKSTWPQSKWVQDDQVARDFWHAIMTKEPVKVVLQGTAFQQLVWQALLELRDGEMVTYKEIANRINRPEAIRAVSNAIGSNPIAILIPCHQVVRTDGSLGGYRWGTHIKKIALGKDC